LCIAKLDHLIVTLTLKSTPSLLTWGYSFSFYLFWEEFKSTWLYENSSVGVIKDLDFEDLSLELEITIKISDNIIQKHIDSYIQLFEKCFKSVALKLSQTKSNNEILTSFTFPEELKRSCEQYLVYFATFLQDLGINATSNLTEEAGKVLFSVTPTDDKEALDKIREALAVYLNLPSSPIEYNESFAAMRLKAEIERFHHSQRMTQLELQSTGYALKLAHKSIEDLQMLNQLQKEHIERISSPTIIKDSLENKEDYEKIFEGLEFGESKELKEKLGIKFNPATAIKTIVRKLSGGDDEIISLKINE
jgi:hypothetical protein